MKRSINRIILAVVLSLVLLQPAYAEDEPASESTPAPNAGATVEKAVTPKPPQTLSEMFLNFDNADLVEVINTIGSILHWNYIIDPSITGTVSIHTEGTISKEDLPEILNTILKVNNVARIQEESLIHFVPIADAKRKVVDPQVGDDPDAIKVRQNFIVQVVKLKYIRTTEMKAILENYTSPDAKFIEYKERNIIIFNDIDSNVKRLLKLVALFDTDIFKDALVKIYPLTDAPADDVTSELGSIFRVYDYPTDTARGLGISFFTIERINAVMAVATNHNLIAQAEKWIKELDRSVSANKIGVYIYNVQNVKAEDLSGVLNTVFVNKTEDDEEYKKKVVKDKKPEAPAVKETKTPADSSAVKTPAEGSTPDASAADSSKSGEGMVEGKINIVTDITTNSIIIKATKRDYDVILETIKKLDIYPKQVLIEVTIAEILLDARTQFGLDWQYSHNFGSGSNATAATAISTGASGIGSGLAYVVKNTNNLTTALRASAQDNKVNILSSPRIIASDNQKAKIEIGEDVPLVTSVYRTNDASSTATTVDQTIQYRSTGILLNVTPRINESGLVQLEIEQEVSEVSEKSVAGVQSPVIYKRSATTVLAANDEQTIIIGGLMKQKKNKNDSGVPFLSKIPIIGYFFSYTSETVEKTELMILITPRVIKGDEEMRRLSYELNGKIEKIKKEFTAFQEEKL